jgi:hypothetical protein
MLVMIGRTKLLTITLIASAAAAVGCGAQSDVEETDMVQSALVGQVPFAFQSDTHYLFVDNGGPSLAVNTGFAMRSGTVPSSITLASGALEFGFQGSNGHFWVGQMAGGQLLGNPIDSNGQMAGGSSPSIVQFGSNIGFGFRGVNGHLFIGDSGPFSGKDTNAQMVGNPSVANFGGLLVFAFHGANGNLWVGLHGPNSGEDTFGAMASDFFAGGSSPSIAKLGNGQLAIAFAGANQHLWYAPNGPQSGFDTGFSISSGTSPALAGRTDAGSPVADVAFVSGGTLQIYMNTGDTAGSVLNTGLAVLGSPSVMATPSGTQIAVKHNDGELFVRLNGTSQDQFMRIN